MNTFVPALIGITVTLSLQIGVGGLVQWTKNVIPLTPPNDSMAEKWKTLTGDTSEPGSLLGKLECILFFGAAWSNSYELIAGWLAFKVASKWEAWSTITAVPLELKGAEDLDYLIARRRWGDQRLMTFLIGTLGNVVAAFVGAFIGHHANQIFCIKLP